MKNAERRMQNANGTHSRPGFLLSAFCLLPSVVSAVLILLVRLYRVTLSPAKTFLFGPAAECRFEPSCSQYALEALETHGAFAGGWLAAKRICRCHPWGGCGHDPVPPGQPQPSKFGFPISRSAFRVSRS
jgi:uncharacterized protein